MRDYESEAIKAVDAGSTDKAVVLAILALKQSNRVQKLADAATAYVHNPSPENYARLAELVDG